MYGIRRPLALATVDVLDIGLMSCTSSCLSPRLSV